MKKLLLGISFLVMACNMEAQLTTGSVFNANAPADPGGNHNIYFYQYKPPHYSSTPGLLPLIISLHGGGQAGDPGGSELNLMVTDGLPNLVNSGKVLEFTWQGKTEGFVMLAPQSTRNEVGDWPPFYVDAMITYGINNLRVDPDRIFLIGFSNGGGGTWKYPASSATAAAKLAGIVPASSTGAGSGANFCFIAANKVATWAFAAYDDTYVGPGTNIASSDAVNGCSPVVPAVDTVFQTGQHGVYMFQTYDFTNDHHYPNVFQWMLKVNRNLNPATNQAPVPVIAGGPVINLTAPVKVKDFPLLDGSGSYDNDDIIMDYLWQQTGGSTLLPNSLNRQWPTATISTPGQLGVPSGTYNFVLRVKDYLTSKPSHTQFGNLTVNINIPASGHAAPATDAGGTRTIPNTQTEVQQIGNAFAYTCTNCGISSYNWVQVAGAEGGPARVNMLNYNNASLPYTPGAGEVRIGNIIVPGTYKFQYSATNQAGDVGSDIFTLIKLSALPVTYAYFNGKSAGNSNVLNWATTVEVNSDRFDILRSADGVNFSKIGSVNSTGGAVQTDYSFEDKNAPLGKTYYRLSQVDKDGHTELSKTVLINNSRAGIAIEKYPNPVHDNLTVTIQGNINGSLQVAVADMQGKTIIQQQWQKDQSLLKKIVNVASLQNGVYQMIITVGNEKQISSFVKY